MLYTYIFSGRLFRNFDVCAAKSFPSPKAKGNEVHTMVCSKAEVGTSTYIHTSVEQSYTYSSSSTSTFQAGLFSPIWNKWPAHRKLFSQILFTTGHCIAHKLIFSNNPRTNSRLLPLGRVQKHNVSRRGRGNYRKRITQYTWNPKVISEGHVLLFF